MAQPTPAPAVEFRHVSFQYLGSDTLALDDICLTVSSGELIVIMGATGAGKSTLAKCLNRIIPTFHPGTLSGEIRIQGHSTAALGVSDLAGTVGLVSQDFEAQLFATNVVQEIVFGMEQLGVEPQLMRDRVGEALATVGLAGFEDRDPSTLSGGEKQRLAIAASLALQPQILVFDEPTTDLDPAGKLEVFAVLAAMRARGYTLILIEHESSAAEHADRLVVMERGRIAAIDTPQHLLRQVSFLEEHGIRAPDLDRIASALRHPQRFATYAAAAKHLSTLPRKPSIEPTSTSPPQSALPPLLRVEAVSYAYENQRSALCDVSLEIQRGEFVALIGQNGSGKTTLAKHLNGLLQPSQGRVFLNGTDLRELPLSRVAADVGYVFQNPDHQIFAASLFEEVAFGPRNLGVSKAEVEERVHEVLRVVGLADLEQEDPFLLGKGQRQRLAVASLLALRPTLLILDEPTTGLDYPEQRRMMEMIAQLHREGMTFVIITHSPWVVAEYAQRGVLMRGGEVVFNGPLRHLFAQEALLESSHFRVPDVTRVGRELGFTPMSVAELVSALEQP